MATAVLQAPVSSPAPWQAGVTFRDFVGSHRVNGVSELHTELMRKTVFRDLHAVYPNRIVNKTNGISFRRWLIQANPGLLKVLREVCGTSYWTIPRRSLAWPPAQATVHCMNTSSLPSGPTRWR